MADNQTNAGTVKIKDLASGGAPLIVSQDAFNKVYNTQRTASGTPRYVVDTATETPKNPTPTEPVNAQGLTMEQANDPKYWANVGTPQEKYVGVDQTTAPITPAPTEPTAPAKKQVSNYDKIKTYLTNGYDNTKDIATALGVDEMTISSEIAKDPGLKNILDNNSLINQVDKAFNDYKSKVNDLNNGIFVLTPDEQAQIDAINVALDRTRSAQMTANRNYEGGVLTAEARSGRQEFMNQISSGIYKQAIDDGISKIYDLEAKASESISKLKTAFEEKRYKQINDEYDKLNTYLKDKKTAINDIYKTTIDMEKDQRDLVKSEMEMKKLEDDINLGTSESLADLIVSNLSGDSKLDSEMIKNFADDYNIDPNILASVVNRRATELNKTEKPTGTVGEYYDALQLGLIPQGTTYKDFINLKETWTAQEKPTTQTINGVLYQYNPTTKAWDKVELETDPTSIKATDAQISLLEGSLNNALKYAGASGRSGLRRGFEEKFKGSTDYTNLVAETNTLRTNILTLMTDPNIKKFFGPQMSNADVQLMTAGGTTLNPELQGPEEMTTELNRLKDLIKNIKTSVEEGKKQSTEQSSPTIKSFDYYKSKYPQASDDEINKLIENAKKTSFNSVGGDTNSAILNKVVAKADGTKGGQCGRFVNQLTGLGVGDSYQSKMAKMNPYITKPEPGMVFTMPYKDTGHVGIIVAINPDGTATVKDSNYGLDEKIKTHKIAISRMTGFAKV